MKRNTKTARTIEPDANQSIETRTVRTICSASPRPSHTGRADLPVGQDARQRVPTVVQTESRRAGVGLPTRTRIGKIARLPKEVREELNRRLQDGEPGDTLLDWLNGRPKVRKILTAQFGGRPISKQNLSEWKQGGYRDWERAEEHRLRVDRFTEEAARLAGSDEGPSLSERLSTVLLAELAATLDELRQESLPPAERLRYVRQVFHEVALSRREDCRADKSRIDKERWGQESERLAFEQEQREQKEQRKRLCAPYRAGLQLPHATALFGGGESGRKIAGHYLELRHGLPIGTLSIDEPENPVKAAPAQPCSRSGPRRARRSGASARSRRAKRSGESDKSQVSPGQAESNPVAPGQAEETDETRRQDDGAPASNEPCRPSGEDCGSS